MEEYIIEALFGVGLAILGAIGTMIRNYVKKKWQMDLGTFINQGEIEDAINRYEKKVIKQYGDSIDEATFKNEILQRTISFLNNQFPKWLEDYGFKPETLEEYVKEKIDDLLD